MIETKPGAGGTIAADLVAKARADGYTLLLANPSNMAIAAAVDQGLRYDPIADFTPIGRLIHVPYFVVTNATMPVKSMPELIAYARSIQVGSLSVVWRGNGEPHGIRIAECRCRRRSGRWQEHRLPPDLVAGRVISVCAITPCVNTSTPSCAC